MRLPPQPSTPSPMPNGHPRQPKPPSRPPHPQNGLLTPAPTPSGSLERTDTEIALPLPSACAAPRSGSRYPAHPTPTPGRTGTSTAGSKDDDLMAKYFKAHDALRSVFPNAEKIPYPTICALGAQNAGKSSALSAIMDFELHCAEKTATHGPTRIASRNGGTTFTATIELHLINAPTQAVNVVHFGTVTDPTLTATAMWFAGEEARRADGGSVIPRTWDALKALSYDEQKAYKAEGDRWVKITANVVSVMVTSPGRLQFDIIDLPGLNGSPEAKNLVRRYTSQKQNLILLCVTAGGADLNKDVAELQIIMHVDPEGARTVGEDDPTGFMRVFIDPDRENGSSWVDYLLGVDTDVNYHPAGGWWPLRLKSPSDRRAGVSLRGVRELERQLFEESDWKLLQDEVGRKFGVGPLSMKLEDMFAVKVRENYHKTRAALREINQEHGKWLERNPAIEDPIGHLHDEIIHAFSDQLKERVHKANAWGALVDLHETFEKQVNGAVPDFLTCTESESTDQNGKQRWRSYYLSLGLSDEKRDLVYMDTLIEQIREHTNKRDPGEVDTRQIVQSYLNEYADQWRATAMTHVDSLWAEMERLQSGAGKDVCGGNDVLSGLISEHLEPLSIFFKDDTVRFITSMHKVFGAPPSDLRLQYHPWVQTEFTRAISHFKAQYDALRSPPSSPTSPATHIPGTLNDASPRVMDEASQPEERATCFVLQAKLATSLFSSATQFSMVVGQYAQYQVLQYVKEVNRTLRKGMRLEQVTEAVRDKADGWVESDQVKRKERKRRVEELQRGEETERELAAAFVE